MAEPGIEPLCPTCGAEYDEIETLPGLHVWRCLNGHGGTHHPDDHIAGHPINASTYTNHGCRCHGCRTAQLAYNRNYWRRNPDRWAARLAHVREMRHIGEWG